MSSEAENVLKKMRAGSVLVGSSGDYGRPFRLEQDGTRDDVSFSVVQELIDGGEITPVGDRGNGQTEYAATKREYIFWGVFCKGCRHHPILLKYSAPAIGFEYHLPPRPLMAGHMQLVCDACGHSDYYNDGDLQALRSFLPVPPTDFSDRI